MNHYPIFGRKVPGSCGDAKGEANPFATITCPKCRQRIQHKVAMEMASSAEFKPTSQASRFHAANAAMYSRVLAA